MKFIAFFILAVFLIWVTPSCSRSPKKFHKPFIIIDKRMTDSPAYVYTYEDVEGGRNWFHENANKYSVGDTIK